MIGGDPGGRSARARPPFGRLAVACAICAVAGALLLLDGCRERATGGDDADRTSAAAATEPDAAGFAAPSETTRAANAAFGAAIPLEDPVDFEEADLE